jgi:hypothetical protein
VRAGFQPLDAVLQIGERLLQRSHTAIELGART